MTELNYNDFRALHKGTTQGELSELWTQYKAGEYQPDADNDGVHDTVDENIEVESDELTTEEEFAAKNKVAELVDGENPELLTGELVEPVIEEVPLTPIELYKQNLQEFAGSYRALQVRHRLSKDQIAAHERRLLKAAMATRPTNYMVRPEDGWQLWVGPHPEALLVNEHNQTAFCITRQWWLKNYQGSFLVQDMILDEPDRLASIRNRYRKKGKLVLRNPIPGIEIKLPSSRLEAIVTSSGSYEG